LVEVLREHRKAMLELWMQPGRGRLPDNALLFATVEGEPLSPNAQSAAWADFAESIGMPEVTFHALRHTHASQLIDAGVDIVTISKRLGALAVVLPEQMRIGAQGDVRLGIPRSTRSGIIRVAIRWQFGHLFALRAVEKPM
jgi:hypothetical protein